MGWRSELEDRYTVKCIACGDERIDPAKAPSQRYVIGTCPRCGHTHKPGQRKPRTT